MLRSLSCWFSYCSRCRNSTFSLSKKYANPSKHLSQNNVFQREDKSLLALRKSCPTGKRFAVGAKAACHFFCISFQKFRGSSCVLKNSSTHLSLRYHFAPSFLQQISAHPLPLLVLAYEATGCVTGFGWHQATLICMPRKNPALCELAVFAQQFTPACGTRNFIHYVSFRFSGEPYSGRKEILQPLSPTAQLKALLPFF